MSETTEIPEPSKQETAPKWQRSPTRVLCYAGWLCWLVTIVSLAVFVWLWKSYQWPPDYRWAAAFGVVMALAAVVILLVSFKRLMVGPDRFGAITGLIVGLLPLLFWPFFFGEIYWRTTSRQSIPSPWVTGPLAAVVSNVIDGEANYRYPRREKGEFVTLIDRGEPEGFEPLIREMDAHIRAMCDELGGELEQPVYWVRGKLLETSGLSFAGWAICEEQPVGKTITYMDRHETAHAAIGLLSLPTTSPPTLLAEGWAQYHSADRKMSQRELLEAMANDENLPDLDEMLESKWYSRSIGPAYTIGGPFAEYLLATFGGERFLALYRNTSPATFRADFHEQMGKEWNEVRSDFYEWLKSSNPDFKMPEKKKDDFVEGTLSLVASIPLADNVKSADWKDLIDLSRTSFEKRAAVQDGAVELSITRSVVEADSQESSTTASTTESTRVLFDANQAWFSDIQRLTSKAIVVSKNLCFDAVRKTGSMNRKGCLVEKASERLSLRNTVLASLRDLQLRGDWIYELRQLRKTYPTMRIVGLRDLVDLMEIDLELAEGTSGKMRIDRQKDMRVVEWEVTSNTDTSSNATFSYELVEDVWQLRDLEGSTLKADGSGDVYVGLMSQMDQGQQRSFVDELRSIEVVECQEGPTSPMWLITFRAIAITWSCLAGFLALLFALFRL